MVVSPAGADSILYAAQKGVWRTESKGKPTKLIALNVDAGKVTRIETRRDSPYVLLEIDGVTAFAELGEHPAEPKTLDCASKARMSPDGLCVGCIDADGKLVVHSLPTGNKRVYDKLSFPVTDFGFASRTKLAVAGTRSISLIRIEDGKYLEKVAGFAPTSHLVISPNGKRAVGTFETGDDDKDKTITVFGFKLDGKAAQRQLASGGVATRWSRDSKWVVMQNGDRTCVVRAAGGEYKCWNGYTGLALSPDNKSFLLSQKNGSHHKLFKATIAGARPAPPLEYKTVDSAAAVWLE